ncbi:PREDICTED: uncharacterized protein LOC105570989, partial [Vollenhovia emeryi]|uniref:uncharacterized protein LOC105570989 n=1 Tax=Vollenhovia emeryi TaxID=411798 RepID=UPI0005F47BAD
KVSQNVPPAEPQWSLQESTAIREQLDELLKKGAICHANPSKRQFISKIFLTLKPDGSYRLILNLKNLNKFISTEHFKLEDEKIVRRLLTPNCYMAAIDFQDAYYLISVRNSDQKVLRFKFQGKLFEFTCLPFGLSTAPYTFTKIMKSVMSALIYLGYTSVIYLDDVSLIQHSETRCQENVLTTVGLFKKLGFLINERKSQKVPSTRCRFLGNIYDSKQMVVELPLRNLPVEKQEKNQIRRFGPSIEIFSDASSSGWGAYCNKHRANGHWNEEEQGQHINYQELIAAWFGLKCFAKERGDCDVLLRIDNTTAIAYIDKKGGVRFPKLAKIAKEIWQWCEDRNLWIFASYIASEDNVEADAESRRLESETEFALAQSAFCQIISKFGNLIPFGRGLPWLQELYQEGTRNKTPVDSADIILAALSDSSLRQYNGGLKKWWKFYTANQSDPFQITVPMGSSLADDSRIKGFFRGVSRLKPPKAKYNCTWDPRILLEYLEKTNSNNNLSLEELSKKLVTLLALVTGHRMQTLALMDIRNIVRNRDGYEIKISENIKTSRPGKVQPNLVIPVFKGNPSVCPAAALTTYLEKTKTLRNNENKLFIGVRKPHKAVGSQTLSRWIKSILGDSGLDTSKFIAYSTRHASTSAAGRSGVNIDLILRTAGRTKKSQTFA